MKKAVLSFVVLFIVGCQQGGGPITQADKDAIQQNIDAFVTAMNGNRADVANVYVDDAISMPPHEEANQGKQNVVNFHTDPEGPVIQSFTVSPQEIEGNGDLAYSRGTWTFNGTLNDTIPINDNGKYLLVLKKQADGSWKVLREIWNSNVPMEGM